jgi:hypothetical protein
MKTIKVKHKIAKVFPYGKVYVPIISKLRTEKGGMNLSVEDAYELGRLAEREDFLERLENFFFCFDVTPNNDDFYTLQTEKVKDLLKCLRFSPQKVEKKK